MKSTFRLLIAGAALLSPGFGFAACETTGLASMQTDRAVMVTLTNRSDTETLHLFWVDFDGHAAFYSDLAPRATVDQPTFAGHVWAIESGDGLCEAVFVAESDMDIGIR